MSVESVKIPQHLELGDVVAWGLGGVDLLCVVLGGAGAWWLYVAVPGELVIRFSCAALPAAAGLAIGMLRTPSGSLRDWLSIVGRYIGRRGVLVTGSRS
jgi:hypothetical protein